MTKLLCPAGIRLLPLSVTDISEWQTKYIHSSLNIYIDEKRGGPFEHITKQKLSENESRSKNVSHHVFAFRFKYKIKQNVILFEGDMVI